MLLFDIRKTDNTLLLLLKIVVVKSICGKWYIFLNSRPFATTLLSMTLGLIDYCIFYVKGNYFSVGNLVVFIHKDLLYSSITKVGKL